MASKDSLTITDNRSGKQYEIPIDQGTIRTADLAQIKVSPDDAGLMGYDPAFTNTATCKSRITYIDGLKGILRYRGYPIEELAERSNYLETAYLIVKGELPDSKHLEMWKHNVTIHTMVHENIKTFLDGFRYDAHPMAMLSAVVASLSAFYHDALDIHDPEQQMRTAHRLIAKLPTIAAATYKHSIGEPFMQPRNDLSFVGNMLYMMYARPPEPYEVDRVAEKALDVLFILHADHEQNASTSTVRIAGSSGANPFAAISAGISSLWGPAHGGANEAVVRMLNEIGSVANIDKYIARAKDRNDTWRLKGFGHRVYHTYDPRARIIKSIAHEVLEKYGDDPRMELAMQLEEIALRDEFFIERKLYPNVDFYSGIIYQALGIPLDMFTVMFAIGRSVGWIAHWIEMISDPKMKICRPRQLYVGRTRRDVTALEQRG